MASSATAIPLRGRAAVRSRRAPVLTATAVALLTFVGLAYLAQTSSVANTGYEITSLQAQRDAWQRRNDQLRLELARAQSLARVEREASVRLRMGPAERVVYAQRPGPERIVPPDVAAERGPRTLSDLRDLLTGALADLPRVFER